MKEREEEKYCESEFLKSKKSNKNVPVTNCDRDINLYENQ